MRYQIEMLAECLAGRVPRSADLVRITNLANQYLVTPQLYVAQSGYQPRSERERDVVGYWERIHRANGIRNQQLEQQLAELLEILNSVGSVPLLLTGAGTLASSAGTATRMVADLDIMLSPDETERGLRALLASGYMHWEEKSRRHTSAKLVKSPHIGLVHVHYRPPDAGTTMSAESMARDAQPLVFWAHRARLPSPTDRLCYLIGHDMLEDRGLFYGELNLRHLLDSLEALESGEIDWDLVRKRFGSGMRKLAYALYRENLNRLFRVAGCPEAPFTNICNVLFHRQMLKSEAKLYAALDQTLFVLPIRVTWRLTRSIEWAFQPGSARTRME